MKKLKNYRSMILMIVGILIGGVVGLIFKEKTAILSPLGDLFLNMLLNIVLLNIYN